MTSGKAAVIQSAVPEDPAERYLSNAQQPGTDASVLRGVRWRKVMKPKWEKLIIAVQWHDWNITLAPEQVELDRFPGLIHFIISVRDRRRKAQKTNPVALPWTCLLN